MESEDKHMESLGFFLGQSECLGERPAIANPGASSNDACQAA